MCMCGYFRYKISTIMIWKLTLSLVILVSEIMLIHGYTDGCSIFCMDAGTDNVCDNTTRECLHGCQPGYTGPLCNFRCCPNCMNCSLSNDSQIAIRCNECSLGYYLSIGDCQPCSEMCARNETSLLPVCNPTDGRCVFGCEPGYYGDTCKELCSTTCSGKRCDVVNGTCLEGCTIPVVTGPNCTDSCSHGCVNRECYQDGACAQSCTRNYWNINCDTPCSITCHNPLDLLERVCNITSGDCLHGCVNSTYWGGNCLTECSATCANRKCDYVTGNCVNGCIKEYRGPTCAERVKDDTTLKTIGIGVGVGGGVLVLLILTSIICCKRMKKSKI